MDTLTSSAAANGLATAFVPLGQPLADTAPGSGAQAGSRPLHHDAAQRWALSFDAAAGLGPDRLGGKGWSLVRMHAHGLPVPAGFCLPVASFERFLHGNGIHLDAAWARDSEAEIAGIAVRIRRGTFPAEARDDILQAYAALGSGPVAVRSSATGEDSAEHSFAGQHDSYLCVEGPDRLLDHIRDCWASLLNREALAYRRSLRIDSGAGGAPGTRVPAMAVVVQAMVPAERAGVAFAHNPLNQRSDQILIEACYGLGEGLVSGRIASDLYILEAAVLSPLGAQVQAKPSAMRWNAAARRIEEQMLAPEWRGTAVLDGQQTHAIGRLLQQCNALFGSPQDIEWAQHGDGIWLLQSRPITPMAADAPAPEAESPHQGRPSPEVARRALWSRMDIGEIFTGRMTPLGLSFSRHYQYKVHRACGTGIGLLDLGDPDEYMGYFKGHVYLNVAYTAYLLSQTPAGFDQRPFLQRFASEDVDLADYSNPYGERHRGSRWRSGAYWLWKTMAELAGAKSRASRMVASRYREFDRATGLDLAGMELNQLREELTHALDYFRAMHIGYLPFYINAFGIYGMLEQLCQSWLPGEGAQLQNRLKGDMSNLRTIRCARDIWDLARAVARYPKVESLFRALPAKQLLARLKEDAEGIAFLDEQLAPFMRENGVRARQEMELSHPRWIDDPAYVFQIMKIYLARGNTVEQRLAGADDTPHDDTETLLRKLPALKRAALRRVIRLYCACSRMREETRMSMITSIWLVRRVLCELARRLRQQGLLLDESELAYLDFEDLMTYANGYASAAECFPRTKIDAARRQHLAHESGEEPPLTFFGQAGHAADGRQGDPAGSLKGLGTSRGRVRAKARVIHDLTGQAGELQRGEIIVTRFTDASWTPLFALAGGIVTDVGSMLSHSSIVAREFGVPCVVNTRTATARIKTGDWLTLDGEAGLIHLETRLETCEAD
ncbi:PEP/pyruvate-binding domain-containing protein [Cupriavidus basilensis]|uniref:PEP/pyruvate-binding domain-containing protein n=1 Tax=Cupriavidus basilensis TaxID=68895 RepID=A0ABT6AQF8_9BURK|nr:PEP/pyruvate-binding domain-containing protein [Cupriavidus basilensis]MDF3834841.1 PEP/pyruvate-binding domain-containing protein [Cupriavidus basilensis]